MADEPSPEPAQQEAQPAPTPIAPAPKIDAAEDQEPDRDPSYYPREDLDAQRRMAGAAEGLVSLTNTQIIIASIAAGLVLVAIAIAFWAALQARRAAIATARTVKVTERGIERQLRAYVDTDSAEFINFDSDGPMVRVKIKNYGQTPAYDVRHALQYKFSTVANTNRSTKFIDKDWSSFGTLSPSNFVASVMTFDDPPLSRAQRDDLLHGHAFFYLFGEIQYRDVFGCNRHSTYKMMFGSGIPISKDYKFSLCEEGNEAD